VHGFTQNGRCWSPFDRLLLEHTAVSTVDLPGHGRSGPATTDLWDTGRAVVEAAPATAHLGYSLGGRVLLHGALSSPTAMDRLILIGAHPGIEDDAARRVRRAEDGERATHLADVGLAGFLDEWLALPLFAGLDQSRDHRAERLTNDAGAVADALRRLGTGTQEPLWPRLRELVMPVLVMAGEEDRRYREVGERTTEAIGPNATFATVPGVGHAVHLQDPERTAAIVVEWLAATA
jgi:2-succinyl-6-hydroxy-2,4-cyclohexadiene-1-carboxylate synthase